MEEENVDDIEEESDFGLETEREESSESEEEVDFDKAFRSLIKNFKLLYDTAKHGDHEKSAEEDEDRQVLFDSIFDKHLKRYLNGERAGGYDDVLKESLVWADRHFIFRAFRYKRLGVDSFDMYVRFSSDEDELIVQSKAYFDGETAKVVKLKTSRLQRRKKIPGQVSADADAMLLPGLSERAFAKHVHPIPKELDGELFLPNFKPVTEKYEMIRIHLEHDERLPYNSRCTDIIRLYDDRYVPLEDGIHWKIRKQKKVLEFCRHHMILYNSEDEPLCVCKRQRKAGERTFIFYSRYEPPHAGAPHIQEKIHYEMVDFYAWFKMRLSRNGEVRLVYAWTSSSGDPEKPASFEPLGKLVRPPNKKRCLALMSFEDEGPYAVFTKAKEGKNGSDAVSTECSIAPGIDPAFAMCIAACLDQVPF